MGIPGNSYTSHDTRIIEVSTVKPRVQTLWASLVCSNNGYDSTIIGSIVGRCSEKTCAIWI